MIIIAIIRRHLHLRSYTLFITHYCCESSELCHNRDLRVDINRFLPPKSGDITRCVNVVDNLGFSPVRMDNQQRFVDKTMIWQCETFNNVKLAVVNVKLAVVLTFIVSLGTILFTNKLWWKHTGHESIRLIKRLVRKAVRLEDSLFILEYISPFNNRLKHLQLIEALTITILLLPCVLQSKQRINKINTIYLCYKH
jgi:hypothetical protein